MASTFQVTSLTYDGLLAEATTLAARILPDWNFSEISDPVRFLVELYLRSIDRATWWANAIGQEFNLETAVDRRFILAHARRLGYSVATRQPSTTTGQLTVTSSSLKNTIAPYAMQFSTVAADTENVIVFENLETVTIPPNTTTVPLTLVQGQTYTESYTLEGTPYELLTLQRSPVLKEETLPRSMTVTINGVSWNVVDGFGDSTPDSLDVLLEIQDLGIATLRFGDNVNGQVPAAGTTATISYRIGGGTVGNVAVSTVTQIMTAPSYVQSVTNVDAASGGVDDQSSAQIKLLAPLLNATNQQLNTLSSIQAYIESTSSVARAKLSLTGNLITAQILTEQGFDAATVINTLRPLVAQRMLMGFNLDMLPPRFVEVTVAVTVWAYDQYLVSDVEQAVLDQINTWLDPLAMDDSGNYINDFGGVLYRSTLLGLLKNVTQIYDYELDEPTANITIGPSEMVTNTHLTTPDPVVTVIGGTQTASYQVS